MSETGNTNKLDWIRATLVGRFIAAWPNAAPSDYPLNQIELPNLKLDRGKGKPWGRLSLAFYSRQNAAIGGLRVRIRGALYFQAFAPEGAGQKLLYAAGDAFAGCFDNRIVTDGSVAVHCGAMEVHGAGAREGYAQETFSIPFFANDDR